MTSGQWALLMTQVADACGVESTDTGRHPTRKGCWIMLAMWPGVVGRRSRWVEAAFTRDGLVEGYAGEGREVLRVLPTVHSVVGEMILRGTPARITGPGEEGPVREIIRVVSVILGEDVMGPAVAPSGLTEPVVEFRPVALWRHLRADHAGLVPMPAEGVSTRAAAAAHEYWHLTHGQPGADGHRHAIDDDAWLLAAEANRGAMP